MMISGNLKQIMTQKSLSEECVAKRAGIPLEELEQILNGQKEIDADGVPPLCYALKMTPNELFRHMG